MKFYPPILKHTILTQYIRNVRGCGFHSLASRFSIKGGGNTIKYWYSKWNNTIQSLEERKREGRPRLLNKSQVNHLIRTPIRNKNRSSTSIHYTQLHSTIQSKIGKSIDISTIRRYGKRDLGIKLKHTKKRTRDECK
jgi:transposase